MADLQLKATITNIAKFEKETGVNFIDAFEKMSVSTMVDLVKACSNTTDEELDAFVSEHGIEALSQKILKAFEDSGFLAKPTTPKA